MNNAVTEKSPTRGLAVCYVALILLIRFVFAPSVSNMSKWIPLCVNINVTIVVIIVAIRGLFHDKSFSWQKERGNNYSMGEVIESVHSICLPIFLVLVMVYLGAYLSWSGPSGDDIIINNALESIICCKLTTSIEIATIVIAAIYICVATMPSWLMSSKENTIKERNHENDGISDK